ncbi:hypothetical protein CFBP6600_12550 [Xanthomonas arboricola pv. corylina]|uniref:Uncharacterized protein n=1 Tax=Xanthomonas arboricola pv. corylina TaxID=487821 RepID=A0A8D6USY0_9XANT|nr:hypothetical protein CFBP6600_12550 [Xanthomonas arboricola pv. corylina]SUZ35520.1 hypothetical protein CPBF1521_13840 [Xanthomonas arboricola pv. juglandis]CAE6734219.1 hypothetical protein CFBP6600_12550 [Xanthomonas arboricola pv. corylina]CAE6734348.1 hypothetical protein XAC301_12680 [Xanthomonas arboricola pv. corylina]CAE6734375.1 hypothetical protein XAC301_12680 [Xanthomonas arboricola pv. corylina]
MPRLPMRLHSGVLRHLTSPTVAGAAPALQFAKATRAPDSRLNHRNSGSHLRGAHGSRIGPGRLRGLRQAAKRNASPRVWMANGRFLLPPGEGAPKGRMRVRSEASCHGWKQHAGDAGMAACLPPSVISHKRVGFAPVPSPQPPLRAPARACGAGAPRHARPWRASCASSPRRERSFEPNFIGVFKISGSWKRSAEAAAWPEIGGERHTDVPRRRVRQDVCRAEEPIPGRAAAFTEASTDRQFALPYPHPNPRSAPRPALAARALQGTRAHGAPAVPPRPDERGASSSLPALLLRSRLSNLTPPAAPAPDPPAGRRCARCRSTAAPCLR